MTIYLDEDWLGAAEDIVYPNVQSCVALVVESTAGELGGMHMTVNTKAYTVQRAADYIRASMGGAVSRILCIGNLTAFKVSGTRDGGMVYKSALAKTLRKAFDWTGTISGHDTYALYTQNTGGAFGGVVVRAWRDPGTGQISQAVGPNSAWTANGTAVVNDPIFTAKGFLDLQHKDDGSSFDQVRIVPKTGKACNAYTVNNGGMQTLATNDLKVF